MTEQSPISGMDLSCRGGASAALHGRASAVARSVFGPKLFVRGVVEVSNFCRENCSYCGMRRDNRQLHRYRAQADQLAEFLIHHRPKSITDLNIQTGEDPVGVREVVLPLIQSLKANTNLGISVCLGSLSTDLYHELKGSGASIYIIKFETALASRYRELQAPGSLDERLTHIRQLADSGWHVSSGFISGFPGQSLSELEQNLALAFSLPISGCSVSPFIPGDETPMSSDPMAPVDLALNCMAAMRIARPNWIIPAVSALNLTDPKEGYRRGLRTGANLATINLTPADVRGDYLLYKRDRFIMTEERILDAASAENLEPSRQSLASHLAVSRSQAASRVTPPG